MKERAKEIADLLKALANKNRLMILCALMEAPMTVGEIMTKMPEIKQSALSQNLKLLRMTGILDSERAGRNITYYIADNRVVELVNTLKKYYCD